MVYAIAIDGPAGSGKSTIAKALSQRLNILYLDTGAMYRALAYQALCNRLDPKDEKSVAELATTVDIHVSYVDGKQHTFIGEYDVTNSIRTQAVSKAASDVAVHAQVRKKLVELQRSIAKTTSLIMDGRDIGTYVLPNAEYKFYLTATLEERAKRRYLEEKQMGVQTPDYKKTLDDMQYRDQNDQNRAFAPLKQASDAVLIDTTHLTIEQVIDSVLSHVHARSSERETTR